MAGCSAFVLPSKPRPEFVETFGIALVEKMLAGGGPVITTDTGGIGEAVGDTGVDRPGGEPVVDHRGSRPRADDALRERTAMAERARDHALQFDRMRVFDLLAGPDRRRHRTGVVRGVDVAGAPGRARRVDSGTGLTENDFHVG
jgi:hypothetical protein